MHCFVTSFQKCNLEYGATTSCFSSPKAEQCLESLLCGKNKKNPSKQTKNPNRRKLVKMVCMSEHWPEVVQVCSALGWHRGWRQELSGEGVEGQVQDEWSCSWPLCWVSLMQELQDRAAAAWRGQLWGVLAALRGGSCAVPWFCSQTVKLHWVMWLQRQEIPVITQLAGLGFLFCKCPEVTWAFLLLLLLHCWSSSCSWMGSWTVVGVDDPAGTNPICELHSSVKRRLKEQIPLSKTSSFFLHSLLVFLHILGQRSAFLHHLQKLTENAPNCNAHDYIF